MNLKVFGRTVLIVVAGLLAVACAPTPVMNIDDAAVVANKPAVTQEDVGKAIIRAGAALNMQMVIVRPGVINATYAPRGDFSAVMEIRYTAQKYSIHYKDSQNLNYDGTNIHRNYNGWVQNLDRNIKAQLSTL